LWCTIQANDSTKLRKPDSAVTDKNSKATCKPGIPEKIHLRFSNHDTVTVNSYDKLIDCALPGFKALRDAL
jgi:hypothetical protein